MSVLIGAVDKVDHERASSIEWQLPALLVELQLGHSGFLLTT